MPKDKSCDKCGKEDQQLFPSTGGINLCHECAHDLGLLHKHPDMGIDDTMHAHCDFRKEEFEPHLKAYRELVELLEGTAQEFRDYMRENGLNIDFISDRTLDAEDLKFRHDVRRAFLLDLEAKAGPLEERTE